MTIYKKLNTARLELQNTDLKKSGHNKFAGYKYFELADFLPTINNIFSKLGLCGVVSFNSELATLTITDTEDGSQVVITSPMGTAALKGCHEVQNIGACETYQRRYLWVTAMEIVEHDALDAITGTDTGAPKQPELKTPILDEQDADVRDFILNIAVEVTDALLKSDIAEATRLIKTLDNDEKLLLWSQLDSKQRSAIKKYQESIK